MAAINTGFVIAFAIQDIWLETCIMLLLLRKPYVTSNNVYYRYPTISIICSAIQCHNCFYDFDIHCFCDYPHDKQVGSDLFLANKLMTYLFRVLIYMVPAGKWIMLRCGWRQVVINQTVMFFLFCPRVSIITSLFLRSRAIQSIV